MENRYNPPGKLYILSAFTALGWVTLGYNYSVYNPTINYISRSMGWPKDEIPLREALGFAMIPIGALISLAIALWRFSETKRRVMLIFADIFTIIGSILVIFDIYTIFLIGRLFLGLGAGINALIAPIYLRELSPKEISGKMGSSCGIGASTGKFLGFLLAFGLPIPPDEKNLYCKFMYLFPILLSVLRILYLTFVFRYETPKYYLLNRMPEEANKIASVIFNDNYKDEAIRGVTEEAIHQKKLTVEVLAIKYPTQMIICMMLAALMQLTGLHTLTAYSTAILTGSLVNEELNKEQMHFVNVINFWMGILRILSASLSGAFLDILGRKGLLIIATAIQGVSLIILAISTHIHLTRLAGAMILLYSFGAALGLGTVNPIYFSELLPVKGCSLTLLVDNLMNLLLNSTFPLLVNIKGFGFSGALYLMSSFNLVGIFLVGKMVVETKGLSLRQIYNKFKELNEGYKPIPKSPEEKQRLLQLYEDTSPRHF